MGGGGGGDTGGVVLDWGAATDVGNKRKLNEDSLVAQPPVFVVADGMGGYEAGEVASALTVELLRRVVAGSLVPPIAVARALAELNREIHDTGAGDAERAGMGTTVVGTVLVDNGGVVSWLIFNVGDSRAYCMVDGRLAQISKDHSYVQELVDQGEISSASARWHPDRNVITRALGASSDVEVDYWLRVVLPGERFLLCSDGLTSEVDDLLIAEILAAGTTPTEAAQALVDAALAAGGRDNVTVVVVDVVSVPEVDGPTEETRPAVSVLAAAEESVIATRRFEAGDVADMIAEVPLASRPVTDDAGDGPLITAVPGSPPGPDDQPTVDEPEEDDVDGHLIDHVPGSIPGPGVGG